jgi:hypothetical protein
MKGGDLNMKVRIAVAVMALAGMVMLAGQARSQGSFRIEKGKAFEKAIPKDFYVEGNAIPSEKRNSELALTPSGARLLVGLIDTTGYSSQIKQKYLGMLISEGSLDVCGKNIGVGSFGFGLTKKRSASGQEEAGARFHLYNQAGREAASCQAEWDAKAEHPRPLDLMPEAGGSARLYLGRDWIELK